jgi:hypothetical protein
VSQIAPSPDPPPRQSARPPVQYRGAELDPARGPGLGCFYVQLVVLVVLVVLTPVSAYAGWPPIVSAILLGITLVLLLFVGQTLIFLLRLVAAERREGRRRPMAAAGARSRTVGEREDTAGGLEDTARGDASEPPRDEAAPSVGDKPPMRQ